MMMITKLLYFDLTRKSFCQKILRSKILSKITSSSGGSESAKGGSGNDLKIAASTSLSDISCVFANLTQPGR